MIPLCPHCGRALEWSTVYVSEGEGSEQRPLWESAECSCGLRLEFDPDQPHLRELRDNARLDREEAEKESGQMRLIG